MPKFALLFSLVSRMLGLRAWGDDLVVVLFEFLADDTKLAQSCTDWLYVQHWYTVVPAMRVTLWALMTRKPSSARRFSVEGVTSFALLPTGAAVGVKEDILWHGFTYRV